MPTSPPAWRGQARRAALRRVPLLVALFAGCRSWRAEPLPVPGSPPQAVHGTVRATRVDGTRIELTGARIARDTLRGVVGTADSRDEQPGAATVAIPLDSVRGVERRRLNIARTAGLLGVIGAIFLAISDGDSKAYGPGSR